VDPFSKKCRNPWPSAGALVGFLIALFVTEVHFIQRLFGMASVPVEFWLYQIPMALGILIVDGIRKLLVRLFPNGPVARIAWLRFGFDSRDFSVHRSVLLSFGNGDCHRLTHASRPRIHEELSTNYSAFCLYVPYP
jgi:hypothetical protein